MYIDKLIKALEKINRIAKKERSGYMWLGDRMHHELENINKIAEDALNNR